jgi:tryptophan synthase alpha chain
VSALRSAFDAARAENRAALIGYLPAGYPSVEGAAEAAIAMVDNGCDVIEIGLPYSDPVMDGPVIARAVEAALAQGVRIADVMRTVEAVAATGAPTLVMTYWNPIERYGVERFAAELAAAGGSGVITPDLTPEEAQPWLDATAAHGIDTVFVVAPSSTGDRLEKVAGICTGFVYAASLMGVTGTRDQVSGDASELVSRLRAHTDGPVAVGLGVSTADQAAEVAAYADGVIVGSAFVRALLDASSPSEGVAAAGKVAAELAEGVRRRPVRI